MDDVTGRIEHTALGPTTTWGDVAGVLDDALRHGMRACVPPQHVPDAVDYALGVDVTTVIGFPHGQHAVDTKVAEARTAYTAGAAEVDLVPDHGQLLSEEDKAYREGIAEVVAAVPIPVKVIVETGLLEESQRDRAARAAADADADYLKTASGLVADGATVEAVRTLAEYLPVKASGGIDSWSAAESMFEAGAERIGTSAGAAIAAEYEAATGDE